jgi:threonine/homoserine/homoserine lactone efflux protein
MTQDLLFGLVVFAAISAFTPGPNNALLMASGVTYGLKRSTPMIFGVGLGFPLMIALVGLGLGQVFQQFPAVYTAMKYAGAAYMLYLAWKIATAKPASSDAGEGKPVSFLQMCMFQWVNPKGWIMSVTALSAYTIATQFYVGLAFVVGSFVVMGFASAFTWAAFGASLKSVLTDPRHFRWINMALAALLVASLVPMLRN